MDFNGWITELSADAPWLLDFTRVNLGRSITTTDQIWLAIRDTEYITPTQGAVIYTGWQDDATYGLCRLGQAPLVRRAGSGRAPYNLPQATLDHPFSMMDRRTDIAKGITTHRLRRRPSLALLEADAAERRPKPASGMRSRVKYLDHGADSFSLVYQECRRQASRSRSTRTTATPGSRPPSPWPMPTWRAALAGGADLLLDAGSGDEVIHMMSIKGHAKAAAMSGRPDAGRPRPQRLDTAAIVEPQRRPPPG